MISKLAVPRPARGIVAKFLAAASITDPTIRTAVDTFYNTLEAANLIAKFDAIYLFVGGTAHAHKFNLLDARDSNDAFRLTFNGGWTHDSNGITGNAINTFANTWYVDDVNAVVNDHHISIYNRTNNHVQYCDMGSYDGVRSTNMFVRVPISEGNRTYFRNQSTGASFTTDLDARGWRCSNRVGSTEVRGSINNTLTIQGESFTGKTLLHPYYIGSLNNVGFAQFTGNRNYSFASIGEGFSDAELIIVYNAVQQLQIDLGRNV